MATQLKLLLQKVQVLFPEPRRRLTTILELLSQGTNALSWPPWACTHVQANTHAHTTHNNKNKEQPKALSSHVSILY